MRQKVLSSLKIRNLHTVKELEEVYQLEGLIWSVEDAIPVNQTIATVKNGGFILGAFYNDKLIGFQYSFPGFNGKNIYLVSHSLGIHPDYRAFGIGERMKRAQKELALEMGYEYIAWTYDPLETVNGNLNVHKLKAVCTAYLEDVYGEMSDAMNTGIATDRFWVEWRIRDAENRVRNECRLDDSYLIRTQLEGDFVKPKEIDLELDNEYLLVPVPSNFQSMKKRHFSLAIKWRETTRIVFNHYLKRGWVVINLLKDSKTANQYVYVLKKLRNKGL